MCGDDHGHAGDGHAGHEHEEPDGGHRSGLTRRGFLGRLAATAGVGAVASASGAVFLPQGAAAAARSAAARTPPVRLRCGLTGHRAAMHLHGSFSEGPGSWASHFSQAQHSGVDILVPTDHDWRVLLRNYGGAFHFSALSETTPSGTYDLKKTGESGLGSGSGGTLTTEHAPADTTDKAGSLRLVVTPAGTADASLAYEVDSAGSVFDLQGTVLGRTAHVWVRADTATTARTWLGLRLSLSNDPVHGDKTLTYRFRTDVGRVTGPVVTGSAAYVDVPVTRGAWTEVVTDMAHHVAAAWPDTGRGDCAVQHYTFVGQAGDRTTVDGLVSAFKVVTDEEYDPAAAYASVLDPLRRAHSSLLVPYGLEHSVDQHFGQIGGKPFFYDYPPGTAAHQDLSDDVCRDQMAQITAHGGVAVFNHPFGTRNDSPTEPTRTNRLNRVMTRLLGNDLYGARSLEVGYVSRGMDLAGHLELWDCLSANGRMVTGVGTSDDHSGTTWSAQTNRFVTVPLMRRLDERSFLGALNAGRACVGLLGDFTGALDLSVNRVAFQGSAYVGAEDPSDRILLDGAGLPRGSAVRLYRGPVDMGGTGFERPTVVQTVAASTLAHGPVPVPVSGSGPRYFRATVVDGGDRILAFTNPVWVVPGGASWIPPGRTAP